MENYFKAGCKDSFQDGELYSFRVNDNPVVLVCKDEMFWAVDDICPHAGASLSAGYLNEGHIICPRHDWVFALDDGKCTHVENCQVNCYDVKIYDGWVYISFDAKEEKDGA